MNLREKKLNCRRCARQVRMQRRERRDGEPARDTWIEADRDGRPHDCQRRAFKERQVINVVKGEDRKERVMELRPSARDDFRFYGRPLSEQEAQE